MQVTREQIDPCTIALDIAVETEQVNRAFDRAYREFGSFTNVPGFRPGKAPRKMLERFVNQERLNERVRDLLAVSAYQDALQEQQISPYADPEVEFSDLAQGQAWQFKVVVPTAPDVKLGDYRSIVVERPVYTVREEDIDREIQNLRAEYARVEKVEGRGIQEGDQVIAEMRVTLEGEEPSDELRRTLVRIQENNIPGFNQAALGQMPDEERTFDLTYPEDFQDPERAGKSATFEMKVVSINETVLPEVTDEWVKSVTSYETVGALRDALRERMEQSLKDLAARVTESRIVEELVRRSEIHYPAIMLREEIQDDMNDLERELQQRRMSYEEYLEATGQTEEQHEETLRQRAEERLRSILALRELAKQEDIQFTDAEIDAEFARMAGENALSTDDLQEMARDDRRRRQVANIVVRRKLRDRLFELAAITDVPAETNA